MHTQQILNLIIGMAIANIAIPNLLNMKIVFIVLTIILFASCSENEKINYYPDYEITAEIKSSKSQYNLNGSACYHDRLIFKFKEKYTNDDAKLVFNSNPLIVVDSIISFKDEYVLDSLTNTYDTVQVRHATYIYDTTYYHVKYKVKDEVVHTAHGYTTGLEPLIINWIVK